MQLYGQLNPGKPVPSFPTIISNIVKNDGPLAVYKGVDAAIGRQMVYGTARIGLHRKFSDILQERNEGKPINFLQKTLCGMASGSVAVCIGTPFDIALVRLQSDGMAKPEDRRNYKNVFDVSVWDCWNIHPEWLLRVFPHVSVPWTVSSTSTGPYAHFKRRRCGCFVQGPCSQCIAWNVHECWDDGML